MCTVKEPLLLGGKVELQGITLGTCHDPALRRLNKRIYFLFRELPFLKSYLCHEKGSFETVENLGPRPLLFMQINPQSSCTLKHFLLKYSVYYSTLAKLSTKIMLQRPKK